MFRRFYAPATPCCFPAAPYATPWRLCGLPKYPAALTTNRNRFLSPASVRYFWAQEHQPFPGASQRRPLPGNARPAPLSPSTSTSLSRPLEHFLRAITSLSPIHLSRYEYKRWHRQRRRRWQRRRQRRRRRLRSVCLWVLRAHMRAQTTTAAAATRLSARSAVHGGGGGAGVVDGEAAGRQ